VQTPITKKVERLSSGNKRLIRNLTNLVYPKPFFAEEGFCIVISVIQPNGIEHCSSTYSLPKLNNSWHIHLRPISAGGARCQQTPSYYAREGQMKYGKDVADSLI
jgi:hypothetical protein